MKRKLFLFSAVALLLASCTSEEPVSNDPQNPEYAAATSYLNINLRPTQGLGTRADDYQMGGGDYEDGTPKENNVTRVRFYFFSAGNDQTGGEPFAVRQNLNTGEYDNFVDWYPNSTEVGGPNHNETVEKTLTATLGLTFTDSQERPAQVIAIANPTDEILYYNNNTEGTGMSSNSMSLEELQTVVANYSLYDENNFVMSNSVYVENSKPVYTTTLKTENFQTTPAGAAQNPVTIYIERVLARVDFGIALTEVKLDGVDGVFYSVGNFTLNDGTGDTGVDDNNGDDGDQQEEGEAIYVKFLGWNVTSTTGTSRLIKQVNPNWDTDEIMGEGGTPWNTADYHRSFWALNPDGVKIQFGNFGVGIPDSEFANVDPVGQVANSLKIPTGSNFVTTYLQENANPYDANMKVAAPTEPSKVIIAAQLVDSKGQPITICEWGYNKYTLNGLKNQIAKALPNLYYRDGENSNWSQIASSMITFTTVDPLGPTPRDQEYYVYAVIDPTALNKDGRTWALKNGSDFEEFTTDGTNGTVGQQVNKYIRGIVNHAMIWNTGLTYYFFDIEHLGLASTDPGYVGIVRNHLYRTTVNGIKGLGTPVYDPSQEIHPQNPNPGETVIQAKINILSWRLVTSSYEVGWQ